MKCKPFRLQRSSSVTLLKKEVRIIIIIKIDKKEIIIIINIAKKETIIIMLGQCNQCNQYNQCNQP